MYLLLFGPVGVGKSSLAKEVAENFKNVVWITTNYSHKVLRKILGREDVWIVDFFGLEKTSERDVIVSNPTNLNEVNIAISRIIERLQKDYLLVFDTISTLNVYNPLPKVLNLLRVLMMKIENDNGKAIFSLTKDAQEKQSETTILMLFPNLVEVFEDRIRVLKSIKSELRGEYEHRRAKEILTKLLNS